MKFFVALDMSLSDDEFSFLDGLGKIWYCLSHADCSSQWIDLDKVTLVRNYVKRSFSFDLVEHHSANWILDEARPEQVSVSRRNGNSFVRFGQENQSLVKAINVSRWSCNLSFLNLGVTLEEAADAVD